MPIRRHCPWLFTVLALLVTPALRAQTFTVCSQNTLHLGYSSSNATKITALQNEFASCQIVLLQEVMRRAMIKPIALPEGALFAVMPGNPGDYYVVYTDLRGATSYKESYAWILSKDIEAYPSSATKTEYWSPTGTLANKFTRNLAGIVAHHTKDTGSNWVWYVDYHAIFGKSADERRAEVRAMPDVVKVFQATKFGSATTNNVMIAGDWNLGADDAAYSGLKTAGFTILPNVDTSLTTDGQPSEPYDHFAYNAGVKVTGTPARITPADMKVWRATVSDHMGISCTVQYP